MLFVPPPVEVRISHSSDLPNYLVAGANLALGCVTAWLAHRTTQAVEASKRMANASTDQVNKLEEQLRLQEKQFEHDKVIGTNTVAYAQRAYIEGVRARLSATTPVVTLVGTINAVRQSLDNGQFGEREDGTVDREYFAEKSWRVSLDITVHNHGPGPALLSVLDQGNGELLPPLHGEQIIPEDGHHPLRWHIFVPSFRQHGNEFTYGLSSLRVATRSPLSSDVIDRHRWSALMQTIARDVQDQRSFVLARPELVVGSMDLVDASGVSLRCECGSR
jgi:hypothetical protein